MQKFCDLDKKLSSFDSFAENFQNGGTLLFFQYEKLSYIFGLEYYIFNNNKTDYVLICS